MVFRWAEHAADFCWPTQGNVLLATGAKELPAFASWPRTRLYPRVLPTREGIAACEALAHSPQEYPCVAGAVLLALNRALLEQFNIRLLVTKDGGRPEALQRKRRLPANTGVQLVVIRRPAEDR